MHTLPASTLRHGFALPFAAVVSIALLLLMAQLIHQEFTVIEKSQRLLPPIIMPAAKPPLAITKPPTRPQAIEKAPQTVLTKTTPDSGLIDNTVAMTYHTPKSDQLTVPILGEGEPVPYLRSQPIYPSRALTRGIEGYVDLQFTITATGATSDINVIAAEPKNTFNNAAIRALSKWKYKPKVVDGIAIAKTGQRTRLRFQINQ